jgi:hypothetical protein
MVSYNRRWLAYYNEQNKETISGEKGLLKRNGIRIEDINSHIKQQLVELVDKSLLPHTEGQVNYNRLLILVNAAVIRMQRYSDMVYGKISKDAEKFTRDIFLMYRSKFDSTLGKLKFTRQTVSEAYTVEVAEAGDADPTISAVFRGKPATAFSKQMSNQLKAGFHPANMIKTVSQEHVAIIQKNMMLAISKGKGHAWTRDMILKEMFPAGLSKEVRKKMGYNITRILRTSYREAVNVDTMTFIGDNTDSFYGARRTADGRPCLACIVRDGAFISPDGKLEDHPNGQCIAVPLTYPNEYLKTGKVSFLTPASDNFGPTLLEGFHSFTEEQQRKVLGRGMFNLWKKEKFALDQVISYETSTPLPLYRVLHNIKEIGARSYPNCWFAKGAGDSWSQLNFVMDGTDRSASASKFMATRNKYGFTGKKNKWGFDVVGDGSDLLASTANAKSKARVMAMYDIQAGFEGMHWTAFNDYARRIGIYTRKASDGSKYYMVPLQEAVNAGLKPFTLSGGALPSTTVVKPKSVLKPKEKKPEKKSVKKTGVDKDLFYLSEDDWLKAGTQYMDSIPQDKVIGFAGNTKEGRALKRHLQKTSDNVNAELMEVLGVKERSSVALHKSGKNIPNWFESEEYKRLAASHPKLSLHFGSSTKFDGCYWSSTDQYKLMINQIGQNLPKPAYRRMKVMIHENIHSVGSNFCFDGWTMGLYQRGVSGAPSGYSNLLQKVSKLTVPPSEALTEILARAMSIRYTGATNSYYGLGTSYANYVNPMTKILYTITEGDFVAARKLFAEIAKGNKYTMSDYITKKAVTTDVENPWMIFHKYYKKAGGKSGLEEFRAEFLDLLMYSGKYGNEWKMVPSKAAAMRGAKKGKNSIHTLHEQQLKSGKLDSFVKRFDEYTPADVNLLEYTARYHDDFEEWWIHKFSSSMSSTPVDDYAKWQVQKAALKKEWDDALKKKAESDASLVKKRAETEAARKKAEEEHLKSLTAKADDLPTAPGASSGKLPLEEAFKIDADIDLFKGTGLDKIRWNSDGSIARVIADSKYIDGQEIRIYKIWSHEKQAYQYNLEFKLTPEAAAEFSKVFVSEVGKQKNIRFHTRDSQGRTIIAEESGSIAGGPTDKVYTLNFKGDGIDLSGHMYSGERVAGYQNRVFIDGLAGDSLEETLLQLSNSLFKRNQGKLLRTATKADRENLIMAKAKWAEQDDGIIGTKIILKEDVLKDVYAKVQDGYLTYYWDMGKGSLDRVAEFYHDSGARHIHHMFKNGALISSENRTLMGITDFKTGMSPIQDAKVGGSNGVFLRMRRKDAVGNLLDNQLHVGGGRVRWVFDTSELNRLDWYAYSRDRYGDTSFISSKFGGRTKHLISKEAMDKSNEVIMRNYMSLDHLKEIQVSSESARNFVIKLLKDNGITRFKGKAIENWITIWQPT